MVSKNKRVIVSESVITLVTFAEVIVGDLNAGDRIGAAEATIRINSIAAAGEVVIVYDDVGNGGMPQILLK
jgi:hypothetical protein